MGNEILFWQFFMAAVIIMFFLLLLIRRADKEYKKDADVILKNNETSRRFRITSALGSADVLIEDVEKIECQGCRRGFFKPTGIKDQTEYYKYVGEIYQCTHCKGQIQLLQIE